MTVTITSITLQNGSQFKAEALDAKKDYSSTKIVDGKEWTLFETKNPHTGKIEKYYIDTNSEIKGEEIQKAKEEKELKELRAKGGSEYDYTIDKADEALDQAMGTGRGTVTTDGHDDGNISWWEKGANFVKGIKDTIIKPIVKHPFKTIGTGLLIKGACMLIPGLGPALLGVALVASVVTLGIGIWKSNTAKTDRDARSAWQKIGAGTFGTVASLIGLRKYSKAHRAAREATNNNTKLEGQAKIDAQTRAEEAKFDKLAEFKALDSNARKAWLKTEEAKAFIKSNPEFKGMGRWNDTKIDAQINKIFKNVDTLKNTVATGANPSKWSKIVKGADEITDATPGVKQVKGAAKLTVEGVDGACRAGKDLAGAATKNPFTKVAPDVAGTLGREVATVDSMKSLQSQFNKFASNPLANHRELKVLHGRMESLNANADVKLSGDSLAKVNEMFATTDATFQALKPITHGRVLGLVNATNASAVGYGIYDEIKYDHSGKEEKTIAEDAKKLEVVVHE